MYCFVVRQAYIIRDEERVRVGVLESVCETIIYLVEGDTPP